uniref:MULE domain-containing protein n=1 Tax=Heterorhabditis bacteriophora TaxID=37862 RepID=A0A1I7WW58_HETBA
MRVCAIGREGYDFEMHYRRLSGQCIFDGSCFTDLKKWSTTRVTYSLSSSDLYIAPDRASLRCVTDDEDLLLDSGLREKSDGRYKQSSKKLDGGPSKQIYSVFAEVQGGHVLLLFLALIKDPQRATYNRLFEWFHDELTQLGALNHFTLPGVKLLMDFELGTIKAIENQLELKYVEYYWISLELVEGSTLFRTCPTIIIVMNLSKWPSNQEGADHSNINRHVIVS